MRIIPVLIKPRLLSLKNRWTTSASHGTKEILLLSLSLAMIYAVYTSTLRGLEQMSRNLPSEAFDPTSIIALLLSGLFVMVSLSALVNSLGAFFSSRDLDLVLSSPLSSRSFLIGKTLDIGVSVCWMVWVIGAPTLIAFGSFAQAGPLFMLGAPLICLGLQLIAVLVGMIAALTLAAIIPARGEPLLRAAVIVIGLGTASVFLLTQIALSGAPWASTHEVLEQVSMFSRLSWLPTSRCAHAITALANGELRGPLLFGVQGIATLLLGWLALTASFTSLYHRGLNRATGHHGRSRVSSRLGQKLSRAILPFAASPTRALMSKEYKHFARDVAHTVQLILLLGLTLLYLYHYQFLRGPDDATPEVLALWNFLLLLTNMTLGSLVVTSICSRFVFPSVSLEGRSFWLLQSAPISHRELVAAKFKSWLMPLSIVSGVVFISGAMAVEAEPLLVVASCAAGVILCQGLVALSIGIGSVFAHFEWEHSTQLSTSLGSFVFMAAGMIFLGINMVPFGLMFATCLLFPASPQHPNAQLGVIAAGLATSYLFTVLVTWWALSLGARALRGKADATH